MTTANLPNDLFARLTKLLLPYMRDFEDRDYWLSQAFFLTETRLYHQIDREGTPENFVSRCLKTLFAFGCFPDQQHSLSQLLTTIAAHQTSEQRVEIELLVPVINVVCNPDPSSTDQHLSPSLLPAPAVSVQTIDTPREERSPTIFLSYSHADVEFAKQLFASLVDGGHACWIDKEKIKGGDAWVDSISSGITNSIAFLSLVSRNSEKSAWVKREFIFAETQKKLIIPILVEDLALPIYLNTYQAIPFYEDYEAALTSLLLALPEPHIPQIDDATSPIEVERAVRAKPGRRVLELEYLVRLGLKEFQVEKFTPLEGEVSTFTHPIDLPLLVMPQEFQMTPWDQKQQGSRHIDDIVNEVIQLRRTVILGEPGVGKTTTLRRVAKEYYERAQIDLYAPIPVVVNLGAWTKRQDFDHFILEQLGELGSQDRILTSNRIVLLLDGLNEIPLEGRKTKLEELRKFIHSDKDLRVVVTCREREYSGDLSLHTITICPLNARLIRDFLVRNLERDGDSLFWKIVGETAREEELAFAQTFSQELANWQRVFWTEDTLPSNVRWSWKPNDGSNSRWEAWIEEREKPSGLMQLARNPYMLLMLARVYRAKVEQLPDNRAELFNEFVETLLMREKVAEWNSKIKKIRLSPLAKELISQLSKMAFEMQAHRSDGERTDRSRITVISFDEVRDQYLREDLLDLAANMSILNVGEETRFTHQLLQEYFAARYLDEAIRSRHLEANVLLNDSENRAFDWTGTIVLLAGLYNDDCTNILYWVSKANPEIAARCILQSGANTPKATKQYLYDQWIPRLVDETKAPSPTERASLGRALGLFKNIEVLGDKRKGLGLTLSFDQLLDWVEIPASRFIFGSDTQQSIEELPSFFVTRYPVTYAQFQMFIDAHDGFSNSQWWYDLEVSPENRKEADEQKEKFWNSPRDNVSWYDAIAFSRWITEKYTEFDLFAQLFPSHYRNKLKFSILLPTELQYERAARWTDGRLYPWGNHYVSGYANIDEVQSNSGSNDMQRTTAVGIYSRGVSVEGVCDLIGNVWEWCTAETKSKKNDETNADPGWDESAEPESKPREDEEWISDDLDPSMQAQREYNRYQEDLTKDRATEINRDREQQEVREAAEELRENKLYPVLKGGSYRSLSTKIRASTQQRLPPDVRVEDVGFRLVCNISA